MYSEYMKPAKKNKRSATTLIEILTALCIMAFAVIPIAGLMGYGGRYTTKDAHRITAIQLLDKTLRQLLAEDYDKIPVGTDLVTYSTDPDDAARVPLGDVRAASDYSYRVTLTSEHADVDFCFLGVKAHKTGFDPDHPKPDDFYATADRIRLTGTKSAVLKLTVKVSWKENGNDLDVSAFTYRANFERRKI